MEFTDDMLLVCKRFKVIDVKNGGDKNYLFKNLIDPYLCMIQ